jgi:hypothetical protein
MRPFSGRLTRGRGRGRLEGSSGIAIGMILQSQFCVFFVCLKTIVIFGINTKVALVVFFPSESAYDFSMGKIRRR